MEHLGCGVGNFTTGIKYEEGTNRMMIHKGFNRYSQKPKEPKSPANQLTCSIITFLRFEGHAATRVNTVGVKGRRIAKESLGMADIVCVLFPSGKHLEVEVKIGRDRPRKEQLLRQEKVQSCGGLYWFVNSFDEFEKNYKTMEPQNCICSRGKKDMNHLGKE